jgi:hypothetical protein
MNHIEEKEKRSRRRPFYQFAPFKQKKRHCFASSSYVSPGQDRYSILQRLTASNIVRAPLIGGGGDNLVSKAILVE